MTNTRDLPNRVHSDTGRSSFTAGFGDVYSVAPMHHVSGLGHEEHVRVSFYGGFSLELDRATAIGLGRRIPEAVAALPLPFTPNCSGALADITEEGTA